jgi:MFS family permease
VTTPPRRGGLLWQRNFRLLWIGETVSGTGSAMSGVLVPLLAVTTLHATIFAVTALAAANYLPWLVIGLPTGAWADRLPPRLLMITCDLLAAILYASLPAAAWFHVLTIGQLLVIALLAGAVNVIFATAYQVFLPALVQQHELTEGNAKLQGSASVALIGGRSAAGLAAEGLGTAAAVLFNAVSFLASAACLLRIHTTPPRPARKACRPMRAEIGEAMRYIVRDPYLRPITWYAVAGNLAYGGYTAILVVFLVRVAGFGSAAVGLLLGTGSVGGIAGALMARRLANYLGSARALQLSALIAGLSGLLIPLARTVSALTWYVAGSLMLSAGTLVGNIITATFRQAYCPPEMLGRVVAGMRFLGFGAIPVGALLAGAIGTAAGIGNALWAVLAVNALTAVILLSPALRSDQNLPTTRNLPTTPELPASAARGDRPQRVER